MELILFAIYCIGFGVLGSIGIFLVLAAELFKQNISTSTQLKYIGYMITWPIAIPIIYLIEKAKL